MSSRARFLLMFDNNGNEYVSRIREGASRFGHASGFPVQAENLFTFTGYDGLDPSLPAINTNGAGGDIRDQFRGIDQGSYPSSKTFSIGVVTSF